jgi:hypothetical protein
MAEVRGIVTLQLVGDIDSAVAAMKRVVAYNEEHFGDRVQFEPFINEDTGRVIWLNSFADESTVAEWEHAMRESGIRAEVIGSIFDVVSVELLTPITDPRLDELKQQAVELRSLII